MKIFRAEFGDYYSLVRRWRENYIRIIKGDGGLCVLVDRIPIYNVHERVKGIPTDHEKEVEGLITKIYNNLNEIRYEDEGFDISPGNRIWGLIESENYICRSERDDGYVFKLFINSIDIWNSYCKWDENTVITLKNMARNIQKCCLMFGAENPSFIKEMEKREREEDVLIRKCVRCGKKMVIGFNNVKVQGGGSFTYNCPFGCGARYCPYYDRVPVSWTL